MARPDFRFAWPTRIRYSEVDGQKIVYNAHYLTFFDTAIIEYCEAIGFDYAAVTAASDYDFHTVRNLIDYHKPVELREFIEVCVRPARIGRTSLTFALEIHPEGDDDVRTSGEVVWVYTNQVTHKSEPLPEDFLELVRSYEGSLPS